jgi:hypothetical protein
MTIREALKETKVIYFHEASPPALETTAREFLEINPRLKIESGQDFFLNEKGYLNLDIGRIDSNTTSGLPAAPNLERYANIKLNKNGTGHIKVSHPFYLYSYVRHILENLIDQDIEILGDERINSVSFHWQRISYDYFLTQEGRIQKNFDRESYVRELARLGFTHIEVNGLAFPTALETGPEGETYPMFYTYCPSLDQFVYSELNKGLYPHSYVSANLTYLKENARLAVKYGLVPGLLCFEPRSVPEHFFEKYPMLRGARVDHPFRSFKPRYNMTIVHPKVQEHYREMMTKLQEEVPELGFICIWTNDSGAGFEHTKSLYVGRNGGAYLVREWNDDEEIARVAGENALCFFQVLQDAGRKTNSEFRVLTRLESFYGEHDTIWEGLKEGIDVETASLIARGWNMPYAHPKYADTKAINAGTIYQLKFIKTETKLQEELLERGSMAHFYVAFGPHTMFEPLLGIPHPTLTYKRLKLLHDNGVHHLAHSGGTCPKDLVSYNINHEICRYFQFDSAMDIDDIIGQVAARWAREENSGSLIKAWELTEKAIWGFPNVTPLYSTHGFTWYRLWIRPLVPNIEAIPREQRAYYEDFMCTTPHNPNNVDLSRDVLFQLTTPEKSLKDVERIDRNVWKPMDQAIKTLENVDNKAKTQSGGDQVISDQLIRLKALRCWFMTQRNVAAWIWGVHQYQLIHDKKEKERIREFLEDMMKKEIQNTKELIDLLDAEIEFMAMTDKGETPLVYGTNIKEHLHKRIELMNKHQKDEPYIDHDYMWKQAGELIS